MARIVLALLSIMIVTSAEKEQTRWSRQISTYTSDIGDWVPLQVPVETEMPQIKRQAVAEPRVLSEPFLGFTRPTGFSIDDFQSRAFYTAPANRHLYLQSVPSASQNYLSEQGFNQGIRFGLTQPNYPLSQGFISPQFSFDGTSQFKLRPQIVSNPVKFETSPKVIPNHKIPAANPVKHFANLAPKLKPEAPKYVDGYRVENNSTNYPKKTPQSLQKIKFETDNSREVLGAPKENLEREEVQLLYVPLESLNRGQFNFRSPITSPQVLNTELRSQNTRTNPATQDFASELQNSMIKQLENLHSQEFMSNNNPIREIDPVPRPTTTTTQFPTTSPTTIKPKKLKPHQPPLAIFLTQGAKQDDQVKVGDVLHSLKNADTVAVLDSVNPLNAPSVFIGPASLTPPENFVKFELPYLSNIENSDKKLRQLPFFVAPLSYNTPQGFAKIPFPAPHVGSVVINSQMKDTSNAGKATTVPEVYKNSYSRPTLYRLEQKPVTQKPVISYYSTSTPSLNSPNYEQNYYSIEPQSVNTLTTPKEQESKFVTQQPSPIKTGSYFLSNVGNRQPYNQYNPQKYVNFPQETNYETQEPPRTLKVYKTESTTTPRTTASTTTQTPTYTSQLLETHNPYSINQAFSLSTPLDYHNFFDEYKEPYATPAPGQSFPTPQIPPNDKSVAGDNPSKPEQHILNEQLYQSSPSPPRHQQMSFYAPEIHNLPENHNLRYPVFNTNDYTTKTETLLTETSYTNAEGQFNENTQGADNFQTNKVYTHNVETEQLGYDNNTYSSIKQAPQEQLQTPKKTPEYNQYDINNKSQETLRLGSSSTSTSTTTTRRTTLRSRSRPRYTTPKPDYTENATRSTITRRPLRERKPLPSRPRYEPNRITTDRATRKPIDYNESTTKSSRSRTRGRIQFKPSDADEIFTKKNKQSGKEQDLAYQRDVLHQNYPVTLMERTSTADIEAITEPSNRVNFPNNRENVKLDDTPDAYSSNEEFKHPLPQYTTAEDSQTGASYVPQLPIHEEDFFHQSKPSEFPQESAPSNDEVKQEEVFPQKSAEENSQYQNNLAAADPITSVTEENVHSDYNETENHTEKTEELTTPSENEEYTKINSHDLNQEQEQEEYVIETTPSYNRVRVRPGVVRKYYQSSSESSNINTDRRKPLQTITYRPAFDRRRTTMRIEEIEADLKTKQIHTRPEFQDYRQPVYKPEPSTEATSTSTTETAKRGNFKRRRPSYATTSTESIVTRRPYEVKNRFRGRRPTEKPTEKPETQSDLPTTTVKNNIYNRYGNRPRFSERYNKNTEVEEPTAEDQDSNYSINVARYVEPNTNGDSNRWSPKISQNSFKPYNPNNIADETKIPTEKSKDEELDIITARNEYEDILISVTPKTNNRDNKKLPDIPPTLEAFVEQSKISKSDSGDAASTFETMLEEVMKSLEEQDENEYTSKVMKHKGGEIGEIPPEIIISSGENYSVRSTTPSQEETTTPQSTSLTTTSSLIIEDISGRKNRRRGFWKKVKVRPASESIDVAESQYYSKVVNHLGQTVSKDLLEKSGKGKNRLIVTTYKPNYHFLKDFFESEDDHDIISDIEITKVIKNSTDKIKDISVKSNENEETTERMNPGEIDLGTGSPDPTFDDNLAYIEPTEPTTKKIDGSDAFNFMDYLFGMTSSDDELKNNNTSKTHEEFKTTTKQPKDETETEVAKLKTTTENVYVPDEFTAETTRNIEMEIATEKILSEADFRVTEKPLEYTETSSKSNFMDPANVVSTSMSTEISHETEICFRGKCIKTNKNVLL